MSYQLGKRLQAMTKAGDRCKEQSYETVFKFVLAWKDSTNLLICLICFCRIRKNAKL